MQFSFGCHSPSTALSSSWGTPSLSSYEPSSPATMMRSCASEYSPPPRVKRKGSSAMWDEEDSLFEEKKDSFPENSFFSASPSTNRTRLRKKVCQEGRRKVYGEGNAQFAFAPAPSKRIKGDGDAVWEVKNGSSDSENMDPSSTFGEAPSDMDIMKKRLKKHRNSSKQRQAFLTELFHEVLGSSGATPLSNSSQGGSGCQMLIPYSDHQHVVDQPLISVGSPSTIRSRLPCHSEISRAFRDERVPWASFDEQGHCLDGNNSFYETFGCETVSRSHSTLMRFWKQAVIEALGSSEPSCGIREVNLSCGNQQYVCRLAFWTENMGRPEDTTIIVMSDDEDSMDTESSSTDIVPYNPLYTGLAVHFVILDMKRVV